MSSSVFFKFKSSKEPQRITFDGTGISVFELKREIIAASGLGDGTDFDLSIYSEDSNEEYTDDTTIIPRSTTVVTRRLPATKPGHGKAARYVSGKAPVVAKNSYRTEPVASKPATQAKPLLPTPSNNTNTTQTEEEKMAAMFQADASQWEQQQQQMAHLKPVHRPGFNKSKTANVPDHEPPPGYICYRCHQKGHWIQACPTNDDPTFESRPRIKRTTGIPKSFLKTIEKPAALSGDAEDAKIPSGVMVNAEGEYVIAEPDQASWEQFQAKAKASAAQEVAAASGDKELEERGLQCPIDKRLFVEPMKTPCCDKTYCNDCIENSLINNDFTCPNCGKDGVYLDNLSTDEDMAAKIKAYEEEKKSTEQKARQASKSPKLETATPAPTANDSKIETTDKRSPSPPQSAKSTPKVDAATPVTDSTSNKRKAENEIDNDRIPKAPAAMRNKDSQTPMPQAPQSQQDFVNQMNAMAGMSGMPNMPGMPAFANGNFMPGMGGFNMPMSMGPMMGMPNGMMNPMMMQPGFMAAGMNGMPNMGFPQNNGMYNNFGMPNNGYSNNNNNNWQQHQQLNNRGNWNGMQNAMGRGNNMRNSMSGAMNQQKNGVFPNQQPAAGEDDAYFRKPVNPHRHQGRMRRARPSDYTQL